ncbi:MAG: isoprenyl transferase [Alphaproteobacteria bacterium]|nr:isoprenyl transferase [Alphaproteobacteria bacterium]
MTLPSGHPQPKCPRHVAIIMDGNGRWAEARGLPRSAGHKAGIDALRRAVRAASAAGVEVLSLYSFSTENWRRPKAEVAFLLSLLRRFIRQDVADLHAEGVRIRVIGARDDLEPSLVRLLAEAEQLTKANTGLTLVIAFNYGSQQELARAARKLAEQVAAGTLAPQDIDMARLGAALDTSDLPMVDLLIRTGGEQRISNFLLWQCAYAEFVFLNLFWPDFDAAAFDKALADFAGRDRRFGGLKARSA